ncbi:MAG: tetratricopeptide repeat protein [Succinivibrionaceae bacterium]
MDISKALEELKLKNYDEAAELFRDAAESGNGDACDFMVQMYLLSLSDKVLKQDALRYAIKGYELRSKDSCFNMGTLYHNGLWGVPDLTKAYEFFLEGADDYHDSRCCHALGEMLRQGETGGAPNVDEAVKRYGEAASRGYYPSQFMLAKIFENVVKDFAVTLDFYRNAAQQGHVDAMLRLGVIYEKGIRVDKDIAQSLDWYEKAAEKGSDEASLKIAKICLQPGIYQNVAEENRKRAYHLLSRLAEKGDHPHACYLLASMLESGQGIKKNENKARLMYCSAAEQGVLPALYKYACMMVWGTGGEKDPVQGFALLHVLYYLLTSHSIDIHSGDDLISPDELLELTEKQLADLEYDLSPEDKATAFKMADERIGRIFGVSPESAV